MPVIQFEHRLEETLCRRQLGGDLRQPVDLLGRAKCRLIATEVVHRARSVTSLLCDVSGASAQFVHSPFQRAQRDLNMIASHIVSDVDAASELYGRIAMGLDFVPGTVI